MPARFNLSATASVAAAVVVAALFAGPHAVGLQAGPDGGDRAGPLLLTLQAAIDRGLQHNLGILLARHAVDVSDGERRIHRSRAMPQLFAEGRRTTSKINLAAFGFPPSEERPSVVGPFNILEARLFLSWNAFDPVIRRRSRSLAATLDATRWSQRDAEDLLVLLVTDAYLRTLAWESQVEVTEAQVRTALALRDLAGSRRDSGLAAGIEVLRAEVHLATERQRRIAARNDYSKQRLVLAQAIGLPLRRDFRLVGRLGEQQAPRLPLEEALTIAYANRADLRAAEAQAEAALEARQAAQGERLPALSINGNYGTIGNGRDSLEEVYAWGANLRVPLFVGGRARGQMLESEARLAQRRAELEDLQSAIYYEVSSVLLDLEASSEEVAVTEDALSLASQQLEQASDRFAAGVSRNLEVVEAQEALAAANEDWIFSLYRYDLNKARMVRVLGEAGR